jgi:BirA family biotin operon repressor/biotin-[acetyl-CoA-carboxylase] ligase
MKKSLEVSYYEVVDSTQEVCKRMIESRSTVDHKVYIIVSNLQTKGRGTKNQPWQSVSGNLHFSIMLQQVEKQNMYNIIGHAVKNAILIFNVQADIKPPNDIMIKGKKVCGILIELFKGWHIIGMGVNTSIKPEVQNPRYEVGFIGNVSNEDLLQKIVQEVFSAIT